MPPQRGCEPPDREVCRQDAQHNAKLSSLAVRRAPGRAGRARRGGVRVGGQWVT